MTRPYSILLVFGLLPAMAEAQEWFPVGARWEIYQTVFFEPDTTRLLEVTGEDTIGGRVMRRLKGGCFCQDWRDPTHVYEENDRVFEYDAIEGRERLLFDFTLHPGDTLTYEYSGPAHFRLDSVTLADFNGTPIRVQHFSWLDGWYFIGDRIYEYMGSSECLNPQDAVCDPLSGPVLCYDDPVHGTFGFGSECMISSVDLSPAKPHVVVYPNPAFTDITVDAERPIEAVRLVPIPGGLSMKADGAASTTACIPVAQLPRGVYAVQVMFTDSKVSVGRVVLQ